VTDARTLTVGDIEVARIGLGTNRLTNARKNVAFLKEAVAAGVGLIDTAHLYSRGESEATVGAALSPVPEGCVVATKGGFHAGQGRPEALRAQIEDSLAVIKEYRDAGKIRHVGVSEVAIDQIERGREVVPIAAVQNHYNLSERKWEDVVDYCAGEGIVFVPFFPLRGDGGREVAEIAERRGATPTQITLAWLLRRSPAMLPIPGTLSLEHLKQNLAALELELTDDEFETLR
jgi:aryl-alcohol dehydrogenase-like predicted oxidoreductase